MVTKEDGLGEDK